MSCENRNLSDMTMEELNQANHGHQHMIEHALQHETHENNDHNDTSLMETLKSFFSSGGHHGSTHNYIDWESFHNQVAIHGKLELEIRRKNT